MPTEPWVRCPNSADGICRDPDHLHYVPDLDPEEPSYLIERARSEVQRWVEDNPNSYGRPVNIGLLTDLANALDFAKSGHASPLRAERAEAERDAWKKAAGKYQRLAADGVLRLKTGMSYAQAQSLYDKALAAEPTPAEVAEIHAATNQPGDPT